MQIEGIYLLENVLSDVKTNVYWKTEIRFFHFLRHYYILNINVQLYKVSTNDQNLTGLKLYLLLNHKISLYNITEL